MLFIKRQLHHVTFNTTINKRENEMLNRLMIGVKVMIIG